METIPSAEELAQRDEQRLLPSRPPPRSEQIINVAPHRRTLTERAVTYRCEWCSQERTELRYPGPSPRYCLECKQQAQNSMAARRMRQMRERLRPQTGWERGRGRPKK